MGKLVYAMNTSLDGFTEDATGSFDWSEPDEEVHEFWNDMMRGVGTQLLGRRMYETMAVWETEPSFAEESAIQADFAARAVGSVQPVVSDGSSTVASACRTTGPGGHRIRPPLRARESRAHSCCG